MYITSRIDNIKLGLNHVTIHVPFSGNVDALRWQLILRCFTDYRTSVSERSNSMLVDIGCVDSAEKAVQAMAGLEQKMEELQPFFKLVAQLLRDTLTWKNATRALEGRINAQAAVQRQNRHAYELLAKRIDNLTAAQKDIVRDVDRLKQRDTDNTAAACPECGCLIGHTDECSYYNAGEVPF